LSRSTLASSGMILRISTMVSMIMLLLLLELHETLQLVRYRAFTLMTVVEMILVDLLMRRQCIKRGKRREEHASSQTSHAVLLSARLDRKRESFYVFFNSFARLSGVSQASKYAYAAPHGN